MGNGLLALLMMRGGDIFAAESKQLISQSAMQTYSKQLTPTQAALLQSLLPQGYSFQVATLDTKRNRPPKKMDESFTTDFSASNIRTPRKQANPAANGKGDTQERVEGSPANNKKVSVRAEDSPKVNNTPGYKELPRNLFLLNLLERLKSYEYAYPFLQPVDPVGDGVPDYWEVIKEPMDLFTIEKKLVECKYAKEEHFHADVRKIISNSYAYNSKELQIYAVTKKFETFYLKICREAQNPLETSCNQKQPINSPEKVPETIKKGKRNDKIKKNEPPTKTQLSMGQRLTAKQRQELFHQIYNLPQSDIIKLVAIVDDGNLPRDWREFVIDFKDIDDEKFKKIVELVSDKRKSYS